VTESDAKKAAEYGIRVKNKEFACHNPPFFNDNAKSSVVKGENDVENTAKGTYVATATGEKAGFKIPVFTGMTVGTGVSPVPLRQAQDRMTVGTGVSPAPLRQAGTHVATGISL